MINYNELFEKSKEIASKSGLTQLELYQRFMFERILERISLSKYCNNFILKGGLLLSAMLGINSRSTRDMDISIKGIDVSKEKMVQVLNEILSLDIGDGISFEMVDITDIRADDEYGGNKYHLVGKLENLKVAYGIYIDNNLIEDEFYILQKRFSNIIFSYNTACYLLNLSDRAPYKIDVTTLNHNNISENLEIHYVAKDKFDIGIIEIESPYSNPIKIYNAERCICDILKSPYSVELEVYNKIINNYFKQKNKDLSTLEEYSKIFNVYEKFEHIMEVLI